MRTSYLVPAMLACLGLVACRPDAADPAAWTISVPEGTPVHEPAFTPVAERDRVAELTVDLVLDDAGTASGEGFYGAGPIAVAADGRIYVEETGSHRIRAFGPDGEYLGSIGREGQGPGELDQSGTLVVVGDRLVRAEQSRMSVWTLDGTHVGDHSTGERFMELIGPLPDGSLLAGYRTMNADTSFTVTVIRLSLEGRELQRLASFETRPLARPLMLEAGVTIVDVPGPTGDVAVSPGGDLYVTNGDEYQVLALGPTGDARWALRVAAPRLEPTRRDRERAVLRPLAGVDVDTLDIDWPGRLPALRDRPSLLADGHGHLYVFPYARPDESAEDEDHGDPPGGEGRPAGATHPADAARPVDEMQPVDERHPVDVYSPDGELLFSGFLPVSGWRAAHGDFIYRIERNEVTEEQQLVRYRLVEPFD